MKVFQSKRTALLLVLLGLALAIPASAKDPDPPFMHNLFMPELVMTKAREVDLSDSQRRAITRAIQETQAKTVELQWSLQDAVSDLTRQMEEDRIDEKSALATAEKMMEIEGRVKRVHLGLLIRIKNELSPDQQKKLAGLRDEAP